MSLQITKSERMLPQPFHAMSDALGQHKRVKVLIPYDGSQNANAALDDLAKAGLSQEVDVLVAVTNGWLNLSPYEITRAVIARRMMVLASGVSSFTPALRDYEEQQVLSREAVRRIQSTIQKGTVRSEVMRGMTTAGNEILRKAEEWGADLIIVGSKSSSPSLKSDESGTVVRMARDSHCSVRIARASDPDERAPIRIIIGIVGSDVATQVIRAVAGRVWPQGSEVHLVAVRKNVSRDPKQDSEMTLALEQSAEDLRVTGLIVSTAIRDGQPQDVLLQEARELSADCIFIGAHGVNHEVVDGYKCGLSKLSEKLALEAHCSVEIVRAQDPTYQFLKPAA